MTQKTPLYEGKAKVIFEGPEDGTLSSISKMMQPLLMRRKKT